MHYNRQYVYIHIINMPVQMHMLRNDICLKKKDTVHGHYGVVTLPQQVSYLTPVASLVPPAEVGC